MKAEVVFQLESAPWPAFLVAPTGALEDVNPATQVFFGERLQAREFTALGEAETSSSAFLSLCDQFKTLTPLKFRGGDGNVVTFQTSITSLNLGGQKYFLFQLYPVAAAGANGNGWKPADGRNAPVEINAQQKQKLDCAMQLTRTVALDFNNSLTTILGHATYMLGQMENAHKWRFSLSEIEKASERASDIANDLAVFSLDEKDKKSQVEGNLNVLIRRAIQLFQMPERKNIVWSQKFEKQMYTVHFDEAKLQQAFVKIVENAVEAISEDSQINGQVSVHTRNVDVTDRTQDGNVQLVRGSYGKGVGPK